MLAVPIIGAAAVALFLLDRMQVDDMDNAKTVPRPNDNDAGTLSNAMALLQLNMRAFLVMLRHSEGTAGADGYRTLFGGNLFYSFADHPRIITTAKLGGKEIRSSAAGAFQILAKTWDGVRGILPDFSPASQDWAAVELIRRRRALPAVLAGDVAGAIRLCAREWASLPGAGYGQPEHEIGILLSAYQGAGGNFYG